jgi:hydrogenase expression/formation protein HypC
MCLAVPGKLLTITAGDMPTGRVDFGGIVREACLACVPDARVGDFVIVHAGYAIRRIDASEAARVFEYFDQIELQRANRAIDD